MFLTSHVMIGYILYKLLNLDANLWIFLFLTILPDASWPFYKNHRKKSWYHTILTFSWSIFFYPYWIAILSHFIADILFGGVRLTPWNKKLIGIPEVNSKRVPKSIPLPQRLIKHLKINVYNKPSYIMIELVLFISCLVLFFL